MKYKKSIERSNFMKRNKSNNVKTHVNDKTDYKTDAADYESWFIWGGFGVAMVLAICSMVMTIYSLLTL